MRVRGCRRVLESPHTAPVAIKKACIAVEDCINTNRYAEVVTGLPHPGCARMGMCWTLACSYDGHPPL